MYKFYISLRYLRSKKVNFFSITGIALGVMLLTIVMSVMDGFSCELSSKLRGTLSDLIIRKIGSFTDYREVVTKVEAIDHVVACSPRIQGLMMVKLRGRYEKYGYFIGVNPEQESRIGDFRKYLMAGTELSDLGQGNEIPRLVIAGNGLLKIGQGKEILVVSSNKRLSELVRTELTQEGHLVEIVSSVKVAISKVRGSEYDLVIAEYTIDNCRKLRYLSTQLMHSTTKGHPRLLVLLLPKGIKESSIEFANKVNVRCLKQPSSGPIFHQEIEELVPDIDIRVDVGEDIVIAAPSRILKAKVKRFKVAGIFKADMYDFDSHNLYMRLKVAQSLIGNRNTVTSIHVRLDDFRYWPAVVIAIKKKLGTLFIVTTWRDEAINYLTAAALERKVMAVILFCIIVVAGFMILGFLTMIVAERTKDIGTLKALGATVQGILSIFLLDGILIGIVGSIMGVVMGIGITLRLNWIIDRIYELTHFRVYRCDIYMFERIPTQLNPTTITIVVTCAICVSVLFSIYPALKAACLDPVEALR